MTDSKVECHSCKKFVKEVIECSRCKVLICKDCQHNSLCIECRDRYDDLEYQAMDEHHSQTLNNL